MLDPAARGLFRQQIQRYLAFSNLRPAEAERLAPPLLELLATSLRAASQLPTLQATRTRAKDPAALRALCEHILASWRDAEQRADRVSRANACGITHALEDIDGDIFFGPRLGGAPRPGALSREDYERQRRGS
jgi:hypothetical protein